MPYLLPDNLEGEVGVRSVCVYFPDLPEFSQALLGSLTFFTKWVAWERDAENRGKIAAALWTITHDLTVATWDKECACPDCPDCPEDEDMTCNNVINVNCGCTGSGDGDTFIYYDGDGNPIVNPGPIGDYIPDDGYELPPPADGWPDVDLDEDEPPEGFETWDSFNQNACATANALVDYVIDAISVIENIFTRDIPTLVGIITAIYAIQLHGFRVLIERRLYVKMGELIASYMSHTSVGLIIAALPLLKAYLIENRDDIVCDIYNERDNLPIMGNSLVARIAGWAASYVESEAAKSFISMLVGFLIPGAMAGRSLVGALNSDYEGDTDCSLCQSCVGGYVVQPTTVYDWVWMGVAHDGESATSTISGNSVATTGTLSTDLYYGRHIIQQKFKVDLQTINPGALTNLAMIVSLPDASLAIGFWVNGTWYVKGSRVLLCANNSQASAIVATGAGGVTHTATYTVVDGAEVSVHLGREDAAGAANGTVLVEQVNNCV